jgi:hypothetical protein
MKLPANILTLIWDHPNIPKLKIIIQADMTNKTFVIVAHINGTGVAHDITEDLFVNHRKVYMLFIDRIENGLKLLNS